MPTSTCSTISVALGSETLETMAASTAISRNTKRIILQTLNLYTRHYASTAKTLPLSSPHLFYNVLQTPRPRFNSVVICSSSLLLRPSPSSPFSYGNLSTESKEPKTVDVKPEQVKKAEESPKQGEKAAEESSSKTDSEVGRAVRGSPVSWISLVLLCLTAGVLLLYFDKKKQQYIEAMNETVSKSAPIKVETAGKAAVGGPFSLINHEGKAVTENDFKGKWTLIYFGFTHCPDICPDELQKLAAAIDKIKEKGIEVVPLFISVDPERDTVEQIGDYVKEFHPDLVGLSGSPEDIKNVARAYRVYYMKTDDEDSDYLVDHSIVMYLMDPDMEFVKFFGKNEVVDTLAEGIVNEIKQYKK